MTFENFLANKFLNKAYDLLLVDNYIESKDYYSILSTYNEVITLKKELFSYILKPEFDILYLINREIIDGFMSLYSGYLYVMIEVREILVDDYANKNLYNLNYSIEDINLVDFKKIDSDNLEIITVLTNIEEKDLDLLIEKIEQH